MDLRALRALKRSPMALVSTPTEFSPEVPK
jgi:hypothetical protein